MRCRSIERLFLAAEDRAWTAAEKQAVEAHIEGCPACREFQEARRRMRAGLKDLWRTEPPDALSERTREVCLDATRRGLGSAAGSRLPVPVVAASVVCSVATVAWVASSLLGAVPLDSWSSLEALPFAARASLLLVAQNVFVLLLAPVILRRPRSGREGSQNNGSTVPEIS